ncbi:phosphotransferase, partial [Streptomyces sp. SID5789]
TRAADAAGALAAFLTALHRPAPAGAPVGRGRAGPLADRAEGFAGQLAQATDLGLLPDPDAVRAVWEDALDAPPWDGPPLWVHADLHPANILTADGTFCGVIDFGDLCAGNPASDLAAAWVLLPDGATAPFHDAYRPSPDSATLRRARGNAAANALGGLLIGHAGERGLPGGKPSWGPPRTGSAATAHRDDARLRFGVGTDKNRPTAVGELPTRTLTRAGIPGCAIQVRVMCSQVERISV